jgi:creatinine amidohydrolase
MTSHQGWVCRSCNSPTGMRRPWPSPKFRSERISLAKANTTPDLSNIVGGGVNRWRTIGSRSASGVIGNPEAASPEKGEALFDTISTALADKLCNPDLWELPWVKRSR